MFAEFAEDRRAGVLDDVKSCESLAVSRQHYYGIAMLWKAVGDLDRAKQWATKLSEKFSPKGSFTIWSGLALNVSISYTVATASDPRPVQFVELLVACGLVNDGRELLDEMEESASSEFDWMDCATIWSQLDDFARAADCLRKSESFAPEDLTELSWMNLAEMWAGLNNIDEARRCLLEAQKMIDQPIDWRMCAERWDEAGDKEASASCLQKAIGMADNWDDWINVLYYWLEKEDETGVRQHIDQACETITEFREHLDVLPIWHRLGDMERAAFHLDSAEAMAQSTRDWVDIAIAWDQAKNSEKASVAQATAEAQATGYDDWETCFLKWSENEDPAARRRCLNQLVDIVQSPSGDDDQRIFRLLYLALEYAHMDDLETCRQLLGKAEGVAQTFEDWSLIGNEWAKLGDSKAMERALGKAEGLASDVSDWVMCAIKRADWGQSLPTQSCLAKAETMLTTKDELMLLADATGALLGKEAEADLRSTARDLAEASPNEPDFGRGEEILFEDWLANAISWHEVGDIETAENSMLEAEKVADGCSEWLACADTWHQIGKADNATGCVDRAELDAVVKSDWLLCARFWEEHGTLKDLERCRKKAEGASDQ